MSKNNIGAETARWAGLQIDLHSRYRSGNLSADELEWWITRPKNIRIILMSNESVMGSQLTSELESAEKFAFGADLGIITVPNDYDHATQLTKFMEKNRKRFYAVNDNITDANFLNPSRVLKPGDKLRVRVVNQVVAGTTISKERMAFLATQKAVHAGAQGASLVFELKRDQLPKGKWCASFDEKEHLWTDADGARRVPRVGASSGGGFDWDLGRFEGAWGEGHAFLCFCDVEPEQGE